MLHFAQKVPQNKKYSYHVTYHSTFNSLEQFLLSKEYPAFKGSVNVLEFSLKLFALAKVEVKCDSKNWTTKELHLLAAHHLSVIQKNLFFLDNKYGLRI